jgi:CheY-like chemotaxis protein
MTLQKLHILIVEKDKDTFTRIQEHLGEEFYQIECVDSIGNALKKISDQEYHLVHINLDYQFKLENNPGLRDFRIPMIIGLSNTSSPNLLNNIREKVAKPEKVLHVHKDCEDYLYKLEWAILNLFPKVFYWYRKRIDESYRLAPEVIKKSQNLEENLANIKDIEEDQKSFKERYISWKSFGEMLAIIMTLFVFATSLIVTLVADQKYQGLSIKYCILSNFQAIWVFIFILTIFSCMLSFLFNMFIKRKLEDKVEKMAKRWYKKEQEALARLREHR